MTHKDVGDEHDPLEPGPSEGGLLRTMPEPSTLHAVVVFIIGAGHTGLIDLEGFAATTLFGHP